MSTADNYLDQLIKEMLTTKPVNSDYFSVIRKVKPGETFSKHPERMPTDHIIPLNNRIKELMNRVGFSYGQLKEKNWVSERSTKKTRMVAPGPIVNSINYEIPKVYFDDKFKAKYQAKFNKPNSSNLNSHSVDIRKTVENSTNRYLSQSPSRRQAEEYLQFLTAISPAEKKILQMKIDGKLQDFRKNLYEKMPKVVSNLNNRGIFSTEVNDLRANSMLNVKLRNQMKIKLEPIVRSVKAEVLRERMQAWNTSISSDKNIADLQAQDQEKKNKLLKNIGEAIMKKTDVKEITAMNATYSSDKDWTEALANSINKMKVKCTPKEQFQ